MAARRLVGLGCTVASLCWMGNARAQTPPPSHAPWVAPSQPPATAPLPPPPPAPSTQPQPVPQPQAPLQPLPAQPYPGQVVPAQPVQPYPGQTVPGQAAPGQPAPSPYYWPAPPQYYRAPIGPAELPYVEGMQPPAGYELQSRRSIPLIVSGSVTLGVAWYVAFVVGYFGLILDSIDAGDDEQASSWGMVMVPAIGPFLGAATLDTTATARTALVMDGLAQVGGIVMLAMGIKTVTHKWVRVDDAKLDWRVSPIRAGGSGMGIGLVGSF